MERPVLVTVIDEQAGRAAPAALAETFEALLADADKGRFLNLLGIGRFSLRAKGRMEPVFTALCAGLWKLAMRRLCPEQCEAAFEIWQDAQWKHIKDADSLMVLVRDVAGHLPEQGGGDFTPAARDMFARAGKEPDQAELVGMALFLRRLYDHFFNHII